ncbi:uncharacterized protein BT62DRAFT_1026273 [Guyanagaster necrorhizus]|uniref:Uncharacterized protein n=1 Tax=Guyanagaster necrorhizus TaxID=856835 RepID=A0A9P7VSS4_9AGAR|nr:uncharacterized protein BT62DRAFT_1026273 [Guyanagaster necrorhizus MCA 3950]KAG7445379.1 hypothetical protein BT62DRAFT_1026273 [Guyanagaster necrorhizus MCA 3950]
MRMAGKIGRDGQSTSATSVVLLLLRRLSSHNVVYLPRFMVSHMEGVTEAQRGAATREGNADPLDPRDLTEKLAALKQQMLSVMERTFKNRYLQPDKLTLVSPKLAQNLADRSSEQRGHLIAFFRALALCHTALSDKSEPQELPYHLDNKAESPDETALVAAARNVGFPFVKKSKDILT